MRPGPLGSSAVIVLGGGGFVVTAPGRLGAVCGDRVLGRLGLLAVTVLARLGACLW